MKKLILLIAVLLLTFTLSGCSKLDEDTSSDENIRFFYSETNGYTISRTYLDENGEKITRIDKLDFYTEAEIDRMLENYSESVYLDSTDDICQLMVSNSNRSSHDCLQGISFIIDNWEELEDALEYLDGGLAEDVEMYLYNQDQIDDMLAALENEYVTIDFLNEGWDHEYGLIDERFDKLEGETPIDYDIMLMTIAMFDIMILEYDTIENPTEEETTGYEFMVSMREMYYNEIDYDTVID